MEECKLGFGGWTALGLFKTSIFAISSWICLTFSRIWLNKCSRSLDKVCIGRAVKERERGADIRRGTARVAARNDALLSSSFTALASITVVSEFATDLERGHEISTITRIKACLQTRIPGACSHAVVKNDEIIYWEVKSNPLTVFSWHYLVHDRYRHLACVVWKLEEDSVACAYMCR